MKFLAFLLLIVSITATFVPCCQFDECQNELVNTTQEGKKDEPGTCSPLSTCPTCAASIVITKPILLSQVQIASSQSFAADSQSLLLAYISSFWQPPKLS